MRNKNKQPIPKILMRLIVVVGSLFYVMILAVLNGSIGFLSSMAVIFFGSLGVAKYIASFSVGAQVIPISYGVIFTLICVFGILRGVLRYIEQYSNHYIAFKLLQKLRDKMFATLSRLAPAKLENKKKGKLISMITSDIETLEVFYAHTLSPIMIALCVSIFVIIMLGVFFSPYFIIIAVFAYLMIGVVMPFILSKKVNKTGEKYRTQAEDFSAYYLDSIKGIKEISMNNKSNERIKEIDTRSNNLINHTIWISIKSAISSALGEAIISLMILSTILIGSVLVIAKIVPVYKSVMASILILSSFGPVIALSALPAALAHTFSSARHYFSLMDEKELVSDIEGKNDFSFESLEINNLKFGYTDENIIIDNLDLKVKKNRIIAIVGDSGIGKSTLLRLIMRIFERKSGDIKFNNISIDDINTASLRDNISFLYQNTYLFNKTIRDNLRVAKSDATDDEIMEALNKASLMEFMQTQKEGLDSKISMMSDNISSGEKQRIGLARVFLKDSPLILLDEPTSNVDAINESIILNSLLDNKKDKAVILITHRLSTAQVADEIYRFENKRLVRIK